MHDALQVLVLRHFADYYLATNARENTFHIVAKVTGTTNRLYRINEHERERIEADARASGVIVIVAHNQEELEQLAMQGKCELSAFEWARLDSKMRFVSATASDEKGGPRNSS